MSKPDTCGASDTGHRDGADQRAAFAVVAHHQQLTDALTAHTVRLAAATGDDEERTWRARDALVAWLRTELVPHAVAEEAVLYPAAAELPEGRLLVDGMLVEHRAIIDLVTELEVAATPVAAAATARALSAVLAVHLAKENDLILPLLLDTERVPLAGLLDGMHQLLGAAPAGDSCGERSAADTGSGCGCGGDQGRSDAPAPVLTVDARIDLRTVPHHQRHGAAIAALDALPTDGALVLIAPHAPHPLLTEITARYPAGQVDVQWLQHGPDVWQVRLHRRPAMAPVATAAAQANAHV